MVLTGIDDGGADELAGDAAAEELGDIVHDGGAQVVEVECILAGQHHRPLEPGLAPCEPADPTDDGETAAEHLGVRTLLRWKNSGTSVVLMLLAVDGVRVLDEQPAYL